MSTELGNGSIVVIALLFIIGVNCADFELRCDEFFTVIKTMDGLTGPQDRYVIKSQANLAKGKKYKSNQICDYEFLVKIPIF